MDAAIVKSISRFRRKHRDIDVNTSRGSQDRRRATMRDVAALAGVGIKTVSRVINDEPNVSPATIAQVRAAADGWTTIPICTPATCVAPARRTRTIGLVVGSVANPFSGAMHRGVEDTAVERGVAVFASSLDDDADPRGADRRRDAASPRRRADPHHHGARTRASSCRSRRAARCSCSSTVSPSGIDADVVVTNNAEAAAEATAHLIAVGHRRIAYLGDRRELLTAQERGAASSSSSGPSASRRRASR